MTGDGTLRVGQLRRQVMLGSEATYRILEIDHDLVTVEVVSAPGLAAGQVVRLSRDAVARMVSIPDR